MQQPAVSESLKVSSLSGGKPVTQALVVYTTAEYFSVLSIIKHYRAYRVRKINKVNESIRDHDVIGYDQQTKVLQASIKSKLEEEKRDEQKWR